MSLITMLQKNDDLKTLIKSVIPNKNDFITNTGAKAFFSKQVILAPYKLSKPWEAALVGMASDYMFRFVVGKNIHKNKDKSYSDLVAHRGLLSLKDNNELYSQAEIKYNESINIIQRFVEDGDELSTQILEVAIFLSKLEQIGRGNINENSYLNLLQPVNNVIITDLQNIVDVFQNVFIGSGLIKPTSDVVFNPHFGNMMALCGGADADIFIDNTLYDFKCTKSNGYHWDEIGQIMSYYFLNCLCQDEPFHNGVDLYYKSIDAIAIYHARFGIIEKYTMPEDAKEAYTDTLASFKKIVSHESDKVADQIVDMLAKQSIEMKYRDMSKNIKRISKPEDVEYKVGDRVITYTKGRGTIKDFVLKDGIWYVVVELDAFGCRRIKLEKAAFEKID